MKTESPRVVMRPRWRDLLFLHWEWAPERIAALLPAGLQVDLFGGRAFVGLVPFRMSRTRPLALPSCGPLDRHFDSFPELNVRTYVVGPGEDGKPRTGVWFFSLDCGGFWATLAARMWFGLPYFKARMRLRRRSDGTREFDSQRLLPPPVPASCRVRYRPYGAEFVASQGSLEEFLVERYALFSWRRGRLVRGEIRHPPYRLRRVEALHWRDDCVARALGTAPRGKPHALWSCGVDVEVLEPNPCPCS